MGFCETGAGLGFEVSHRLLHAPPTEVRSPPEVMLFEVAFKDGYGPSVGHDTSTGYLIIKWTLPSTERVTVEIRGEQLAARLMAPSPA